MRLTLLIAAIAFAIYYFRRYWLTPWGTYVSHSETKAGDVFLVVRHVHWYPPFLDFERTYHGSGIHSWSEEKSGNLLRANGTNDPQSRLDAMLVAAKARQAELDEIMGPAVKR